ncbi:MoxR family ATPase [Porticoccaceae bacterium]|nr:MoxR family ATPase [Porticoccaceae bacterium]
MMNKREEFLGTAAEMFPTKTEFTRSELVEVANKLGMKYAPSWIVKSDEFKLGNGLYSLVSSPVAVMPAPVVQQTAEVVSMPTVKKTISVADTTINNIVPSAYENYVPFGQFSDVKSIIKSKMFYPIFITGLSGNGKTMMVEQVCAQLRREFFRVNITIETDEDDLLGGYRLQDGETVWFDGPVVQAMKRGAVLLLDEVDLASNKIMCIQPILEGKGVLLKKINQFVEPTPGFQIVATANTKGKGSEDGRFIGTNILNEAFLERFPITVEQEYPSPAVEKKILIKELQSVGKPDEEFADMLTKWADVIRKTFLDGGIDELIATRRLVHIVKAFSVFGDRTKAIQMCINRFDDETKSAFMDLYTKVDADAVIGDPADGESVVGVQEELDKTPF